MLIRQCLSSRLFWYGLSLVFSLFYSFEALQKAFRTELLIQDDARQYIVWFFRFFDEELFPNDLIANYFQSVTPEGYHNLYRLFAWFDVSPLLLHKVLPLGLGLILTSYAFLLALKFVPVPYVAFLITLLLNQSVWFQDDLVSATPRAFVYPLFTAFLYYLLSWNLWGVVGAIALLGTFYPQYVIVSVFTLILFTLSGFRKKINHPKGYRLPILGIMTGLIVLLPYALETSQFDPVITREQALTLPEFSSQGRTSFFFDNPIYFWLFAERSALIPALMPPLIWLGLFFPYLLKFPSRFPLIKKLQNLTVLSQILLASFICWLSAHLLLFRLHLPSRYMDHSGRIVMAVAGGITIALLLQAAIIYRDQGKRFLKAGGCFLLVTLLLLYPHLSKKFPFTNYRPNHRTELYQFLQQQPQDTLVASIDSEANFIPAFSQRSTFLARSYAIPYHWGYYKHLRDRAEALIRAQYTPHQQQLAHFIQDYKIDLIMLHDKAFSEDYLANNWTNQYQKATEQAITNLKQETSPALTQFTDSCSVYQQEAFHIVATDCILESVNNQ